MISGASQGSLLNSLYFLIYMNDFAWNTFLFANDRKVNLVGFLVFSSNDFWLQLLWFLFCLGNWYHNPKKILCHKPHCCVQCTQNDNGFYKIGKSFELYFSWLTRLDNLEKIGEDLRNLCIFCKSLKMQRSLQILPDLNKYLIRLNKKNSVNVAKIWIYRIFV